MSFALEIEARVFNHFGCSTFKHNQKVVRDLKKWKKEGDSHHAYFTSNLSCGIETLFYFYHLFSYSKLSRGKEWEASLKHAIKKSNAELATNGFGYRLV